MTHTPDIDLPKDSAAEDEKEKAEGPPVIVPFRRGLSSEEILVRVVLINMAFHTILLCHFHVRFAGIGLGVEHQKKGPCQYNNQ